MTYFANDAAYHLDKYKRKFDKLINIWGADHSGYISRVTSAVSAVTNSKSNLEVKVCQLVRLMRSGNVIKMSKRSGSFITLRDLVDEVGSDAVRFMMVTRKNDAPLDFDYDLVKEAARFFDYADLTEVHHEAKIDAPSGTALAIAQAAVEGKGSGFEAPLAEKELIADTRGGTHEGVVIHSGRMPGRVAHHEMVFGSLGQTLTLRHDSINRESFMPGVIMAIKASETSNGLTVGLDKIMGL